MTAIALCPSDCSRHAGALRTRPRKRGFAVAMLIAMGVACPLIATSSHAAPLCRYTCSTNVAVRPTGYSAGFHAGYTAGQVDGYAAGRNTYAAGYAAGYNYGFAVGYNRGQNANTPPYGQMRY
ncbi:hypothetical protein [Pseudomonas gingeri]